MYTSGWPKIQNRCCHSSGSAPASTEKNVASNERWNISRNSATVITGIANTSRNCTTSTIHVKIGIFISDMPGCPHVDDGDDQVERAGQRGDAGDLQPERPEVDAVASARTAPTSSART